MKTKQVTRTKKTKAKWEPMTSHERSVFWTVALVEVLLLAFLLFGQILVRLDLAEKKIKTLESKVRLLQTDIDIINKGFDGD